MKTDLPTRLEGAAAGSRELDAEVEVAARAVEAARSGLAREHWAKWRASRSGIVGDAHTQYASPPVTTSIDAIVALADRVLDGCIVRLSIHRDGPSFGSVDFGHRLYASKAATPALALCAAIIRARAEQVQG